MSQHKSNFFADLFSNKKKLSLLLLLLGGTGVVTTTLILASPSSASPTSSASSNSLISQSSNSTTASVSSGTTSASPTSVAPYEGNTVPNWDLSKPNLSPDSSSFDLGLDMTWFQRYQGDFLYAAGGKLIDGAPQPTNVFMAPALRIINIKTGATVFSYTFSYGSTYETYLKTSTSLHSFDGSLQNFRLAYDGGDFIYAAFTFRPQSNNSDITSRVGGSFEPLINAVNTRYSTVDEALRLTQNYSGFVRFSKTTNTFAVLGVSNQTQVINDVLVENNKLYAFHLWINPVLTNTLYSFVTLSAISNEFTPSSSVYLLSFSIATNGDLTQIASSVLGSTGLGMYPSFFGQRVGFLTQFMNENNELFISGSIFFGGASSTTLSTITTATNALKLGFLEPTYFTGIKPTLIAEGLELADDLFEYGGQAVNLTLAYSFNGYFNFTTGLLSSPAITPFYQYYDQSTSSNVIASLGQGRQILLNSNFDLVTRVRNIFAFTFGVQSSIAYHYTLFKEDRATQALTKVLEYDNVGIQPGGIFERDNGFYLSGTIYENATNSTIKKSAAFLRSLNNQFETVAEVLLDGTEEDIGLGISLNNQAQPVWFVRSRSIDGPFEAFASVNPNKVFRTYTVTF